MDSYAKSQGKRKFAIGLTGGIGSGKSTVADLFAARGTSIIDTDLIAHQLTAAHGDAMPVIEREFGAQFVQPDGALDRTKMRAHVFDQPQHKKRLEAILHPLIRQACEAQAAAATGAYIMFAVPLLVESGSWKERVDRVLVVDCPEETQVSRVMQRSGLTRAQVLSIMAVQASRSARLAAADDVITNANGIDALAPQVDDLHARYLAMAQAQSG
ncbi:MAG: dephospho-CoA kinase [Burkholderiaceae bacterium]